MKSGFKLIKITKIEKLNGKEDMIDLSVDEHENFILKDGIVTHNSHFITKTFDCFIDGFCYTKIGDLATLKNGSKAKIFS